MRHPLAHRHQALPSLVVLLALISDANTLPAGECPQGYYRSAAIIFGCEHSDGTAHYLLAPAATTSVVNIPAGVRNFTLKATADTSIYLKLVKASDGSYIVNSNSRRPGIITDNRRSGNFQGMPLNFSGEDVDSVNTEKLEMFGTLPAPTILRFGNGGSNWGTVAMRYSHDGLSDCPLIPDGCELYDEGAAQLEVVDWSRWAQSEYESADEAWLIRGAPHAKSPDGGVFWHSWPAVFSQSMTEPTKLLDEDWQPAFYYFDSDHNGEVSQSEFESGYAVASSNGGINIVGTIITTATLTTSTTPSTSTVPAFISNHTPLTLPYLHKANWQERNRGWLIAGALVFLSIVGAAIVWLHVPRKRKRGVRSVRSRDSDGQLELSEDSATERGAKDLDEGDCSLDDTAQDLDESFSTNCTDASNLHDSGQELPRWVPRLLPLLPFWRSDILPELWRPTSSPFTNGPAWSASSPTVRYGPLPTVESFAQRPQLRPAQVAPCTAPLQPTSPLLRPREQRLLKSPSATSTRTEPVSSAPGAGSSFGPLRVIQASPEHLESLKAAPKVHVVEESQSFVSSPGQESVSKVDFKVQSFNSPGSPLSTKAPWAAVFTPEEWSRTAQLASQPPQSAWQADAA